MGGFAARSGAAVLRHLAGVRADSADVDGRFGLRRGSAVQKGQNAISAAMAAVILLIFIAVHQRWQLAGFKKVVASAKEYVLASAGPRGQVPELSGFAKVKTFALGTYQGALYRASPAPLTFSPGRFVIYDSGNKPVFKLDTLEGSREPWTAVYDFAGRNGISVPGGRHKPKFTLDLTGDGTLEALIGQYSGGDHCCTVATIVELGKESVRVLGRIGGLDGLPFEGVELRKIDKNPSWEIIAHQPYRTLCGEHEDAADVLAIYGYVDGRWNDQTSRHVDYLRTLLRLNSQEWSRGKDRSLQLLQTIAGLHALLGEREMGKRQFAMGISALLPMLREKGIDINACLEDATGLLDRLSSVVK